MRTAKQSDDDITSLLKQARHGRDGAEEALLALVRRDLHDIAKAMMRRERPGHVLQPTALVNEAYLRLFGGAPVDYTDRKHFFRTAARAMRRVLIDEGRRRQARRRGGDPTPVELDEHMVVSRATPDDAIALAQALEALAARDARQADILDLHFWAGYTDKDIARELKLSERTIEREIRAGVLFVRRFMATA